MAAAQCCDNGLGSKVTGMQTMTLVPLFPVNEIAAGDIRQAHLPDGHALAIYNINGQIFATDDCCTHGAVSLSEEGSLSGTTVECSWHFGTFDVTTGAATGMPCEVALKTYPVHIEDGIIHVQV
jgi:p-cumate 2,3-dioxygenase ferredoxin subunit